MEIAQKSRPARKAYFKKNNTPGKEHYDLKFGNKFGQKFGIKGNKYFKGSKRKWKIIMKETILKKEGKKHIN